MAPQSEERYPSHHLTPYQRLTTTSVCGEVSMPSSLAIHCLKVDGGHLV